MHYTIHRPIADCNRADTGADTGLRKGEVQVTRGGSRGGGPGGQDPPLLGTPKLHKEGKNGARVRAKTPHFST